MKTRSTPKLSGPLALFVVVVAIAAIFGAPSLVTFARHNALGPTYSFEQPGAQQNSQASSTAAQSAGRVLDRGRNNSQSQIATKVITDDTFSRDLGTVSSFYQTVIQLLLAALAIVAAFGLWSINMVSKTAAEELVHDYLHSERFKSELQSRLKTTIDDELQGIKDELNSVRQEIALIQQESDEVIVGGDDGNSPKAA